MDLYFAWHYMGLLWENANNKGQLVHLYVWLVPLFSFWKAVCFKSAFYMQNFNILASLCSWAGWLNQNWSKTRKTSHTYINMAKLFKYNNVVFNLNIETPYSSVSARLEFLGVIDVPWFENLGVMDKLRGSELLQFHECILMNLCTSGYEK